MTDLLAIGISFVYVFAVLGLAEGLRRALKLDIEFTRKVVHIAVGMWAWGTAALFQNRWLAMVTPAAFVIINALSYRYGLLLAMESRDRRNLGTIYFPLAFIAMIALFWGDLKPLFVAGLMPMTWGDDVLTVLPGTLPADALTERLARADAAVIMKLGRNLPKVRRALTETGLLARALYVERGTMAGEKIERLADKADDTAPYFSLVLVPGEGRRP